MLLVVEKLCVINEDQIRCQLPEISILFPLTDSHLQTLKCGSHGKWPSSKAPWPSFFFEWEVRL